jgi:hypothetical protein
MNLSPVNVLYSNVGFGIFTAVTMKNAVFHVPKQMPLVPLDVISATLSVLLWIRNSELR